MIGLGAQCAGGIGWIGETIDWTLICRWTPLGWSEFSVKAMESEKKPDLDVLRSFHRRHALKHPGTQSE